MLNMPQGQEDITTKEKQCITEKVQLKVKAETLLKI